MEPHFFFLVHLSGFVLVLSLTPVSPLQLFVIFNSLKTHLCERVLSRIHSLLWRVIDSEFPKAEVPFGCITQLVMAIHSACVNACHAQRQILIEASDVLKYNTSRACFMTLPVEHLNSFLNWCYKFKKKNENYFLASENSCICVRVGWDLCLIMPIGHTVCMCTVIRRSVEAGGRDIMCF